MTSTIATDAPTLVATAYRWMHRGDVSLAEHQLRQLTPAEMREASTTLLRTAVIVAALLAEYDMAKVLTPNPAWRPATPGETPGELVPELAHEHRYNGLGLCECEMSDSSDAAAWAPECDWCHAVDCAEPAIHAQLHRLRS